MEELERLLVELDDEDDSVLNDDTLLAELFELLLALD